MNNKKTSKYLILDKNILEIPASEKNNNRPITLFQISIQNFNQENRPTKYTYDIYLNKETAGSIEISKTYNFIFDPKGKYVSHS